jgi:hypothetical protein
MHAPQEVLNRLVFSCILSLTDSQNHIPYLDLARRSLCLMRRPAALEA